MKAWLSYCALALGLGLAAGGSLACGRRAAPPAELVRPVITMKVQAATGRERWFSGTARAAIESQLSFRVGGEIRELPAKLGLAVKAHDLIARLDSKDYDLQAKQSQAQLAQAEAQLQQAQSSYERVRQQYETKITSKSELDGAQAAYKSALASRDAAQKGMELAKQQLDYCLLKAPMDGVIAAVPVEVHQTVAAGQTVALLAGGGDMEMRLGLPAALISQVKPADAATVVFDAIPGGQFKAGISEIGIESDATGTYPIKLRLLDQDPRIRSGMVGEARFSFPADGAGSGLLVPPAAVVSTPAGERFVWVYAPDQGAVIRQPVTLGALTSDGLQVTAGLQPGMIIVIRGVHQLQDGQKVRLLEP